jgi:hypothetical protein
MIDPSSNRFIGNRDPPFRQQILDITEAQGEPDIKPNRLLNNLGREAVAAITDLGHHRWLRLKSLSGKPTNDVTRPFGLHPTVQKSRGSRTLTGTRRGVMIVDMFSEHL